MQRAGRWLFNFAAALAILFFTEGVRAAEPSAYTTESIELIAGNSPLIIRGTVASVGPDRHRFFLRVEETLRGEPVAEYRHQVSDDVYLPEFIVPGHQVLLIKFPGDRRESYHYPLIDLEAPFDPPFWTMFGQAITTSEQLLPAFRKAIAETPPGAMKGFSIPPLNDQMNAVLKSRGGSFGIPLDERAEPIAYQMLASPVEIIEWRGLVLLSQIPTPKNIEHLRQYLTDPRLRPAPDGPLRSPWSERSYWVRLWASTVLKWATNTPVTGVRLTEPANTYRAVPLWTLLLVPAMFVGLWLLMGRVSRFRPRGYRVLVLSAVSLIVLAGLWRRSNHIIDDFCYADGNRLYALSIHEGRIRFEVVYKFHPSTPLTYATFTPWTNADDPRPWHELSANPGARLLGTAGRGTQRSPIISDSAGYEYSVASQPLSKLAILLSLGLFAPLVSFSRRALLTRRRRRQGLCASCGYDLRATPDRCPECGTIPPAVAISQPATDERRTDVSRLRRWLFNFAAAVSLVLCMATAVLWAVSRVHTSTMTWRQDKKTAWFVSFHRGQVEIARQSIGAITEFGFHGIITITDADVSRLGTVTVMGPLRIVGGPIPIPVHGASTQATTAPVNSRGEGRLEFDPHRVQRSYLGFGSGTQPPFFELRTLPCWFVTTLCALPCIAWLPHQYRIRRRRSKGLCLFCGYDLRATPDRCPECGTIPPAAKGSAT